MTACRGIGKTHLATGLGILTAELAHRLFFLSGLARLGAAFRENQLPSRHENAHPAKAPHR